MPEVNNEQEWSTIDLFDLHQYLRRGYSIEETAEFLGRAVEEVKQKAEELRLALKMGRLR
jgi:hypothetical protein